jgi:uncharacterized protein
MTEYEFLETEYVEDVRPEFTFKDTGKLLLFYFVGSMFVFPLIGAVLGTIVALVMGIGANDPDIMTIAMFFSELIATGVLLKLTFDILKYDFKVFRSKLGSNLVQILKNFVLAFGVSFLLQIFYEFIGISQSVNQDMIVDLTESLPVIMFITTVIFAPLTEEIIFRGGFYKGMMNIVSERSAIILSSLLFGGVHLLAGINSPLELLFIFQYANMGYFMAKTYRDTDSIWGAIGYHFLNNFVAIVAVIYG